MVCALSKNKQVKYKYNMTYGPARDPGTFAIRKRQFEENAN